MKHHRKSFIILQQTDNTGYVAEESSKNHRDFFSVIFVLHPDLKYHPRMELRA